MQVQSLKEDINHYIESVADQLPLLAAQRSGIALYGAPLFNAFNLFEPKENALTRVLSCLLDPGGSHGQNALFLNYLLSSLRLPLVRHGDETSVRIEHLTTKNRRIDLVIQTPEIVLGIENKPWAAQSPNQLSDYIVELKHISASKKYCLILLSDQQAKTAAAEVKRIPYIDKEGDSLSLHKILTSAVEQVRAPKIEAFVNEFLSYIDSRFGKGEQLMEADTPYIEAVMSEYERSGGGRQALAAALLAQDHIHGRIVDEIEEAILSAIDPSKKLIKKNSTLRECLREKWSPWQLTKQHWPKNCSIAIESGYGDFDDCYFGIRALDEASKEGALYPSDVCSARVKLAGVSTVVAGGRNLSGGRGTEYLTRLMGP